MSKSRKHKAYNKLLHTIQNILSSDKRSIEKVCLLYQFANTLSYNIDQSAQIKKSCYYESYAILKNSNHDIPDDIATEITMLIKTGDQLLCTLDNTQANACYNEAINIMKYNNVDNIDYRVQLSLLHYIATKCNSISKENSVMKCYSTMMQIITINYNTIDDTHSLLSTINDAICTLATSNTLNKTIKIQYLEKIIHKYTLFLGDNSVIKNCHNSLAHLYIQGNLISEYEIRKSYNSIMISDNFEYFYKLIDTIEHNNDLSNEFKIMMLKEICEAVITNDSIMEKSYDAAIRIAIQNLDNIDTSVYQQLSDMHLSKSENFLINSHKIINALTYSNISDDSKKNELYHIINICTINANKAHKTTQVIFSAYSCIIDIVNYDINLPPIQKLNELNNIINNNKIKLIYCNLMYKCCKYKADILVDYYYDIQKPNKYKISELLKIADLHLKSHPELSIFCYDNLIKIITENPTSYIGNQLHDITQCIMQIIEYNTVHSRDRSIYKDLLMNCLTIQTDFIKQQNILDVEKIKKCKSIITKYQSMNMQFVLECYEVMLDIVIHTHNMTKSDKITELQYMIDQCASFKHIHCIQKRDFLNKCRDLINLAIFEGHSFVTYSNEQQYDLSSDSFDHIHDISDLS